MYSRSPDTDGTMVKPSDDFLGVDKCNHGEDQHYQEKWDKYDKGYKSIPAEHLISIQTAKYQGNK